MEKQKIVSLMRELADEIEKGSSQMGVSLAFVVGHENGPTMSGHFVSHMNANVEQRVLLRGQMQRMNSLDDDLERGYKSESHQVHNGSAGTLLN